MNTLETDTFVASHNPTPSYEHETMTLMPDGTWHYAKIRYYLRGDREHQRWEGEIIDQRIGLPPS